MFQFLPYSIFYIFFVNTCNSHQLPSVLSTGTASWGVGSTIIIGYHFIIYKYIFIGYLISKFKSIFKKLKVLKNGNFLKSQYLYK